MLTIGTAAALLAPPAGWEATKSGDGCQLYAGPAEKDGVVPVLAVCHWTDTTAEKLDSFLANWPLHADIFSSVVTSTPVRVDGARTLVHQEHSASGISDREVNIWMQITPLDGGGNRYAWTIAKEEPLIAASGHVAVARDDGAWDVKANPAGGVDLSYHLEYDPGGSVPGFIVHWFQGSGVQAICADLHTWAQAH